MFVVLAKEGYGAEDSCCKQLYGQYSVDLPYELHADIDRSFSNGTAKLTKLAISLEGTG